MFSLKPKEGGATYQPPTASPQGNLIMKIAIGVCVLAILAVGYVGYSNNIALQQKIASVEDAHAKSVAKLEKDAAAMDADIQLVGKKLGVTSQELDAARKYAEKLRIQQEESRKELSSELA